MVDPLADLQYHWGEVYGIDNPDYDVWVAQRRGSREVLRASTPGELHDKILADYEQARPST